MSKPIEFWYNFQDSGIFDGFTLTCPHCNTETPKANVEDDEVIVCSKCGAKFKIQQRVWVEEVSK